MKQNTRKLLRLAKANQDAFPKERTIMARAKRRVMARVGKHAYRQGLVSGYGHK